MEHTLDYESIEIYLGDRLRRRDNLDIHADHFFPVSLLDNLFHYSEKHRGTELDNLNRTIHRNFHGHDFDRWIDNLVAHTCLNLRDEDGNHESVDLVDIDSMTFGSPSGEITVTLPDETSYTLVDDAGHPVIAHTLDSLDIEIDLADMFDRPPVDDDSEMYLGFGPLAQIVRVVCERTGLTPGTPGSETVAGTIDPRDLSERIFRHFHAELLPLIPSLWNDMEHIYHYARPGLTSRP